MGQRVLFLDLPMEIETRIYEFALFDDNLENEEDKILELAFCNPPDLFYACTQIQEEAVWVFFSIN